MYHNKVRYENATAIVLAAGQSVRFQDGNKLLQDLHGMPVAMHIASTLISLPFAGRVAVCSAGGVANIFDSLGFHVVINEEPAASMGQSLKAGVNAAHQSHHILVCLADMPLVSAAHLSMLFEALAQTDGDMAVSKASDYLGPPTLISRKILNGMVFDGDRGARNYLKAGLSVLASADELLDVDTKTALERARAFSHIVT